MKCPKCQFENPKNTIYCGTCGTKLPLSGEITIPQTKTLKIHVKELTPGSTFAGRYQIIKELGRGGMGVVYKAEDTKLKRTVALKFLPPELICDSEAKARLIQEAQAAASLDHPKICTVYEVDEVGGKTFISMAYVDGQSMREKLASGPLELDEAIDVSIQIAEGLWEAHKKGIVHRDIKSANIMVTEKDQAKIMDFGLAKFAGAALITEEGTTMGTAAYMSPEQARGESVDSRTDIWSFGVVLYEMLTGQLPFKGEHGQAIIYSILNSDPEPLAGLRTDVPKELERIVKKALAKSPDKRYQHIDEMLADIQSIKKEIKAEELKVSVFLLKYLIKRRIPQILGLYLVAIWGIIKFVEWLMNRYILSPHLPDFSLIALLSMIPAVSILAHFYGRRSQEKRKKLMKIGIPLNLLASAALLLFIFHGKDLGAATQVVTLENEEGQVIERVIPKTEFRKKFAIFFFMNETEDPRLDWMQYGISHLLGIDLSQDIFLEALTGYYFYSEMKEAGYPKGIGLPLNIKSKIADDLHRKYFVLGSFTKQNGEFFIKTSLYETKKAKLITESTLNGEHIFELVDEISVKLKHDLQIPKRHIEKAKDLPVSEIGTNSIHAFELYITALIAKSDQDWEGSLKYLEQSVKEDPFFAFAYFELQELYALSNLSKEREEAFQSLWEHRHKLPERQRFLVESEYYLLKKDPERQLAIVKMWAELFPEDIVAHATLAGLYTYRNQLDEALSEYMRILKLGPEQYDVLLQIGSIHKQKNEFKKALRYYKQYADQFPMHAESYATIGELYKNLGDYEQAKAHYEKASLLEPESVSVLLALAGIETKVGDFEKALKQYHEALGISKTHEDTMQVYDSLMSLYETKGQLTKTLEYMHLKWDLAEKNLPKASVLIGKLPDLVFYIKADKKDVAFKTIEAIEAQLVQPWARLLPLGYLSIYLELEDADNAEQTLEDYEKFIKAFGFENLRFVIPFSQGMIHEIRGNYEQAILSHQKSLELAPTFHKPKANREIGKCYRNLKEFEKAEKYIKKALKLDPFDPELHYELALVYLDREDKKKALEHLRIALDVWKDADPGIAEVEDARKRLAELRK